MPKTENKHSIKIFYAWQSDLPVKFNRQAIKKSLKLASAELETELSVQLGTEVEIIIDEATRELPGSPHIPTAILEKIQAADIFVADVSTINSEQTAEAKKTPNPNVVFELGYAVAHLGWERVLLLVNEVHGPVKGLPFDFDRQRASPFKLGEGGIGSQKELTKMLAVAISLIVRKDPPRPKASHFDIVEVKRERDLTNLRWLLQSINWPIIDEHIASGAKYLIRASTDLFDEVSEIVSSSTFHIYDAELEASVLEFVRRWGGSMKYDHYVPMIGSRAYIFKSTHHPSNLAREEADWDYMDKERIELRKAADSLLALIREKYPEIDIQALSQATGKRYYAEIAEIEERFAGIEKIENVGRPISRKTRAKVQKRNTSSRKSNRNQ